MKNMPGMQSMQKVQNMPDMEIGGSKGPSLPGSAPVMQERNRFGPANSSTPMAVRNRFDEPSQVLMKVTARYWFTPISRV